MKNFDNQVRGKFTLYGSIGAPFLTSITIFLKRQSIFHKYQHWKVYLGIVLFTNLGFYFLINNPLTRYIYLGSIINENCFNINNIFADFSSNLESSNEKVIKCRKNLLLHYSELIINKREFKEKLENYGNRVNRITKSPIIKKELRSSSKLYNYFYLNWLIFTYEKSIFNTIINFTEKRKY